MRIVSKLNRFTTQNNIGRFISCAGVLQLHTPHWNAYSNFGNAPNYPYQSHVYSAYIQDPRVLGAHPYLSHVSCTPIQVPCVLGAYPYKSHVCSVHIHTSLTCTRCTSTLVPRALMHIHTRPTYTRCTSIPVPRVLGAICRLLLAVDLLLNHIWCAEWCNNRHKYLLAQHINI